MEGARGWRAPTPECDASAPECPEAEAQGGHPVAYGSADGCRVVPECLPTPQCDACPRCDDTCDVAGCSACGEKRAAIVARGGRRRSEVTPCQVRRHCTEASCWLVASNVVYDATAFVAGGNHPGGTRSILRKAGRMGAEDCTTDFGFHSKAARKLWKRLVIGRLVKCGGAGKAKAWWKLSEW